MEASGKEAQEAESFPDFGWLSRTKLLSQAGR